MVAALVVPYTVTVDLLLDEVELSDCALSSDAHIVGVEPREPGRAVVVAVAIS